MQNGQTTELARSGTAAITGVGQVGTIARTGMEVKAQAVLARQFPRNENECVAKMKRGAARMVAADRERGGQPKTLYTYPRGGVEIQGPSVYLARMMAATWGNIRTSMRVLEVTATHVHVVGCAWDLESNAYTETEDRFRKRQQRKRGDQTVWVEPDERDLRELTNKRAAICVRNAILTALPDDIVAGVVGEARRALTADSKTALEDSGTAERDAAIKRIVGGFDRLGVSPSDLMGYLGHPIEELTPEESTALTAIWASISDGETQAWEHFPEAIGKGERPDPETATDKAAAKARETMKARKKGT
jgi:hypothetical protein